MSESLLVTHCSPTLAGLKTGNLFNCKCECVREVDNFIRKWNKALNPKGVYIKVMRINKGMVLIYVYRKAKLMQVIQNKEIREFMEHHGYTCTCLETMLDKLAAKLQGNNGFPHEIGVFLGYPFEDVKAFIANKGKNYKHVGHWKVYTDEHAAIRTFSRFKKCTELYCQKLEEGTNLLKLTVNSRCIA